MGRGLLYDLGWFSLTDKRATLRSLDALYGVMGKFGINGMVSSTSRNGTIIWRDCSL